MGAFAPNLLRSWLLLRRALDSEQALADLEANISWESGNTAELPLNLGLVGEGNPLAAGHQQYRTAGSARDSWRRTVDSSAYKVGKALLLDDVHEDVGGSLEQEEEDQSGQ